MTTEQEPWKDDAYGSHLIWRNAGKRTVSVDAAYVNSLEAELATTRAALAAAEGALNEIIDSTDLHNAERAGTDICHCELGDVHAGIAVVALGNMASLSNPAVGGEE